LSWICFKKCAECQRHQDWPPSPQGYARSVTGMTENEVVRAKLDSFCRRFDYGSWNGPFFHGPETAALDHVMGTDAPAQWVVWMEKPGVRNSVGGERDEARLRATLRFNNAEADALTIEALAQMMVGLVAGLEAHEVLEFSRLDGTYVVNPHGSAAELHHIAGLISEVIESSPQAD
jgi:hypothetical protein